MLSALPLLSLLFVACPQDLTPETLQALKEEAWEIVKEYAPEQMPVPVVRIVDVDEVREALIEDLLPQRAKRDLTEDQWERQVVATSRLMSESMLAKFSLKQGDVMVVAENIEKMAELYENPDLAGRETLGAVLVHEFIHAIDQNRFQFDEALGDLQSIDEVEAINALIEGHANGWLDDSVKDSDGLRDSSPSRG